MKFVELKMVDTRKSVVRLSPPFREWKIGYVVENSYSSWQIEAIRDADGNETDVMTYTATVDISQVGGDERRTVRGATLQGGYKYLSGAAKLEDEYRSMTMSVGAIRNFYPRKDNLPGTRIVTTSGVAYVVADSYDEVRSAVLA